MTVSDLLTSAQFFQTNFDLDDWANTDAEDAAIESITSMNSEFTDFMKTVCIYQRY
jgi:hypothetical protein